MKCICVRIVSFIRSLLLFPYICCHSPVSFVITLVSINRFSVRPEIRNEVFIRPIACGFMPFLD